MKYSRSDAKDYAFDDWHGVCNVILPSFTADLKDINEVGIRHDVRRNIEQGFWGTLLVAECGATETCGPDARGRVSDSASAFAPAPPVRLRTALAPPPNKTAPGSRTPGWRIEWRGIGLQTVSTAT